MSKAHTVVTALLSTAVLLVPRAHAQETTRIVITPYAGIFVPSARIAETPVDVGGELVLAGIRQQTSIASGLTAGYSFNNFAGLEVSGAWAFSEATGSTTLAEAAPGLSFPRHGSAHVVMGAVKLMINLLPLTDRAALRLGLGPAVISRGGSAFTANNAGEFGGLTDVGGAISLCSRLPLTDFLAIRLRAENYLYTSNLTFRANSQPTGTFRFASQRQNDFMFSAGLQMVWWR